MNKKELGKFGQDLTIQYLKKKSFDILGENIAFRVGELDIVAFKNKKLFFVEVKTRTNYAYGNLEDSISMTKLKNLEAAINSYMLKYDLDFDFELIFSFVFVDKNKNKNSIKLLKYA